MAPAQPGSPAPPAPAGATPPHSIEAEQSVLGAILLSEKAHYAFIVEEDLKPEDFYRARHRVIFEAMSKLFDEGVDRRRPDASPRSCKACGKLEEVGGGAEIAGLDRRRPGRRQPAPLRGDRQGERAPAPPARRLLRDPGERPRPRGRAAASSSSEAERAILEVAHDERRQGLPPVGEVLDAGDRRAGRSSRESGTSITGTPLRASRTSTTITGGFQPGNLIILAARPSMGKSALVTNIAENVALDKTTAPVALFSLEMSETELAQRFIASPGARSRATSCARARSAAQRLAKRRAEGLPTSSTARRSGSTTPPTSACSSCARRRAGCTRAPRRRRPRADHRRLPAADARGRRAATAASQQVGQMSRGLKILARELEGPGDRALAALPCASSSAPTSGRCSPTCASRGQIEQDADLVDVHLPRRVLQPRGVRATRASAEIIIAKHRNGGLGDVRAGLPARVPAVRAASRGDAA